MAEEYEVGSPLVHLAQWIGGTRLEDGNHLGHFAVSRDYAR